MKFHTQKEATTAVLILENVKKVLPIDRDATGSHYICDQITTSSYKILGSAVVASDLKDWIAKLIGYRFSLETWLRDNHGIHNFAMDEDAYYQKLQATRQAWLDWMIQEIKEKNGI